MSKADIVERIGVTVPLHLRPQYSSYINYVTVKPTVAIGETYPKFFHVSH